MDTMKRVGQFFLTIMVFSSAQSVYGQVNSIESTDEFKQETRHGMVAVLWYSKDAAHEGDKEWNKAYEKVQKAYGKLDNQTNHVRFFTVDLAKASLAPLRQEQGLSTIPHIAAVSLYKDGSKRAVLESITTKSWRTIRDELNAFIRNNFGSAIGEIEQRHKRERERAEEEADDDSSDSNVSIGLYAGYPATVEYYDDPYYYGPYSYAYGCAPYGYYGGHHHYYRGSGRRGAAYSVGRSRPSSGRISSFRGGHGGGGRGRR